MKNSIKIFFTISVFSLLMTSCYKDKGNYDYIDVKIATIVFPDVPEGATVLYDRLSTLTINPEIYYDGTNAADHYTYEWTFYSNSLDRDPITGAYPATKLVGEERRLEYVLVDAPGNYTVVLKATHKETGSIAYSNFKVTISGAVIGWLVLTEDAEGNGDLSVIRNAEIVPNLAAGLEGAAHGLYSGSNNGTKMTDVKFLGWRHRLTSNANTPNAVFVYTSNGYYKMNALGLNLLTTNYDAAFGALVKPKLFNPQAMFARISSAVMEVFINDGSIFTINWQTMGIANDQYSRSPAIVDNVEVKAHPFIASTMRDVTASYTVAAVVYDDTTTPKGSFVVGTNGSYVLNWSRPVVAGAAFNPSEINADGTTEMKLVYLATGRDGTTCAIFKDARNANRPWIYHADFRLLASPSVIGKYDISSFTGINAATHFEFGVRGDVLFYTSGNTVYSVTFPNGTPNSLLTLGSDETVACIRLYNHGHPANMTPFNPNTENHGRILFVATNSPSGGKVHKIRFNELNGLLDGPTATYTGFDKIIDMINKAL